MSNEEKKIKEKVVTNTFPSRFRPTEEELKAYAEKGAELLLNATKEDMEAFSEYTRETD